MKTWVAVLAGLLVAGLAGLGLQRCAAPGEAEAGGERAQWERGAARWRMRAEEALEQKVTPATFSLLAELLAEAQRIGGDQPPRANASEFRFALSRVEAFAARVRVIDWEEVQKWERDMQAVSDTLRQAMADARNWEEERPAALRAAENRLQELRGTRPWCADEEPEEEVRRAISQARAAGSGGRR